MKKTIVIGAAFGDEGKGRTTHDLCDEKSLVVRFSGGQQAGHTVINDGIKHIFSSYGAGTIKGCKTFFTEDTTFYLPNILNERIILRGKGIDPKLVMHPLSMATTPYDIAYNRAKEFSLGHGSCGLGVGSTMNRTLKTGYKLFAVDFLNKKVLEAKLDEIKKYYFKLAENEFAWNSVGKMEFLENAEKLEQMFYDDIYERDFPFKVANFENIVKQNSNIVFEGSQGVLLDMDHGVFPNVTYANTTSKNALKYCYQGDTVNVVYATRCYSTRHGNGWFLPEKDLGLINNSEEINITNKYQGKFRIAEFDYDLLSYAIEVDSIYSKNFDKTLVVTCCDQRPDFNLEFGKLHPSITKVIQTKTP